MQHPVHAIGSARREWKTEHLVGIGFVVVLHIFAVYAIVSGLGNQIVRAVAPPDLVVQLPHDEDKPLVKRDAPKPPTVEVPKYSEPTVVPPVVNIETTETTQQLAPAQPQQPTQVATIASDTAASAVAGTHTIPPYPAIERKLGNQGTVKLRLTISTSGAVAAADVVQSSGFPGLDQAAVSWVMQHWKYKPAVQGGQPVASTTIAAVVFNIRNG